MNRPQRAPRSLPVDEATALDLYRRMVRVRICDDSLRRGMAAGEFAFTHWPVQGHDAMSAGAAAALRTSDQMIITYRGLGDAVAKGVDLPAYFAELFGKNTGLSRGRAGAMGISQPDVGLVWATGIVGAGPPIANGLALANQLKENGKVVLVSFGDGATSIGAMHEAMNMAAVWDLPIIFFCQNNAWAECTPMAEYTRTKQLAERAAGYGMPGETVDGNDPVAVYSSVRAAVARAREGRGPTFVEGVAYRLQGHYFGDGMNYVPKDELEQARANDPVPSYRRHLLDAGIAAETLDAIDEEEAIEVAEAIRFANESPDPDPKELQQNVYANTTCDASLSVAPAPAEDSSSETVEMTYAAALTHCMDQALERDESVIILGEDVADPAGGIAKLTKGLSTRHGAERVRSTPIAETSIIGAALGAAMEGMRPIAEIMYADFLGVCLDQIVNHAAKLRYMTDGRLHAPMTIRVGVGRGNGPQHSQSLEAWLLHTPGLKIVFPSTPGDMVGLLNSCIDDDDPCIVLEATSQLRSQRGSVPSDGVHRVPLGSAAIRRPGRDATVVSYGPMVRMALSAAEELEKEGLDIEVIDLRTLLPLDMPSVLESVGRTGRLLVTHQATAFCGIGAEISDVVSRELFGRLAAPVSRLGGSFNPVPRAAELENATLPGVASISIALRALCGKD